MAWWKDTKVFVDAEKFHIGTLYDMLSPGICKIKGVRDVLAGRVEQGIVKPSEEAIFFPTHTRSSSQWKRTISSMETRLEKLLNDARKYGELWCLCPGGDDPRFIAQTGHELCCLLTKTAQSFQHSRWRVLH